jgi:hypothetical protein
LNGKGTREIKIRRNYMTADACCSSDKSWEAECDARALMEANIILADPKRKDAAIKAMDKMKKDKVDELKAMQDVMDEKEV